MTFPVILGCLLIFVLWFTYERKKSDRKMKQSTKEFIDREYQANLTRRKDISNLSYIKIPVDTLPLSHQEDDTLKSLADTLRSLASEPILNLSSYTNTELKETYGVANLDFLSKCDFNYTLFVNSLMKYAERLFELHYINDAKKILEYAVSVPCDSSHIYHLLSKVYKEEDAVDKIDELITRIPEDVFSRDTLIRKLTQIKYS